MPEKVISKFRPIYGPPPVCEVLDPLMIRIIVHLGLKPSYNVQQSSLAATGN